MAVVGGGGGGGCKGVIGMNGPGPDVSSCVPS